MGPPPPRRRRWLVRLGVLGVVLTLGLLWTAGAVTHHLVGEVQPASPPEPPTAAPAEDSVPPAPQSDEAVEEAAASERPPPRVYRRTSPSEFNAATRAAFDCLRELAPACEANDEEELKRLALKCRPLTKGVIDHAERIDGEANFFRLGFAALLGLWRTTRGVAIIERCQEIGAIPRQPPAS